ncbi:MAG TPA: SRPBCC family protein [Gemmatimonadaceae bacterium]|nr:SRPBCC family protein [Gemmatimonadaceae bacterium]
MATAIEPGTRAGKRGRDGNTGPSFGAESRSGQAQGGHYVQPDGPRAQGEGLASFLGWFSIGLGVAQITAPGALARLVGVEDSDRSRSVMRTAGVREIAHGIGIFSAKPRPAGAVWSRVAGDVLDLAFLGKALSNDDNARNRTAAATAAVLGVTALDVLCAQRLTRSAATTAEQGKSHGIRTKKSITVRLPVEEVYRFWRNFENLPRFMRHLESVEVVSERRSHWKAKAPAGLTVEWDAEIVDERPNELISWRSLEGADVSNAGTVRFQPAPGGRGTEVRVELQYDPPGGKIGSKLAMLFREEPGQQVQDDLRVFKQVMETGDIVLSDATVFDGPHPARPPEKPVNRPEARAKR